MLTLCRKPLDFWYPTCWWPLSSFKKVFFACWLQSQQLPKQKTDGLTHTFTNLLTHFFCRKKTNQRMLCVCVTSLCLIVVIRNRQGLRTILHRPDAFDLWRWIAIHIDDARVFYQTACSIYLSKHCCFNRKIPKQLYSLSLHTIEHAEHNYLRQAYYDSELLR